MYEPLTKDKLRLISDLNQPELENESMDLRTGAVPGDGAVPDGRRGQCMEATLGRGRWRVCHCGISDGQKDRRNRGGFLYSDRRTTAERGQQGASGEVGVAVSEQRDEDQEGGGRGDGRRKDFRTLETTD